MPIYAMAVLVGLTDEQLREAKGSAVAAARLLMGALPVMPIELIDITTSKEPFDDGDCSRSVHSGGHLCPDRRVGDAQTEGG